MLVTVTNTLLEVKSSAGWTVGEVENKERTTVAALDIHSITTVTCVRTPAQSSIASSQTMSTTANTLRDRQVGQYRAMEPASNKQC